MNTPINPYKTPQSEPSNIKIEKHSLQGLSGWLVLVGIGVVLSPIRMLMELIATYKPLYEEDVWGILTSVDSDAYNSMWAPLLITEIVFNIIVMIASAYLIYLFFTKHYFFPKLYIIIVLSSLIFIVLDAWVVTKILPNVPMFDPETTEELTRSLVSCVIWVPYMLISKRVKATFIEKRPSSKDDLLLER